MNSYFTKKVWVLLLSLVYISSTTQAGVTGKISGIVTAKDTNEPLIGVNITLVGTTIGTVTDFDGKFILLNVTPGNYNIKSSLVGYTPVTLQDVRVFIDQTSNVEFQLSESVISTSEVIVVAQRVVEKDVATSKVNISGEQLVSLPIKSATEVASLQAGVESGLVIRGGNASQALFLVDGVTLRDPRNNTPMTSVPLSAISEVSIERGGFNAEYGQLRSGVMNVVTKEGKRSLYDVTLTARYSPPAKKYFGVSPYDPGSMWLRPYLDPSVAWNGTDSSGAWDYYTLRQYPRFDGWNKVSSILLSNEDSTDDLSPAAAQRLFMWQHRKREVAKQPDYNIDFGFGGPVPWIGEALGDLRFFAAYQNVREMLLIPLSRPDYYEDSWLFKLTSEPSSTVKLNIIGTTGGSENIAVNGTEQANATDYIRSPFQIASNLNYQPGSTESRIFLDSYYSLATIKNNSIAAHVTYFPDTKSFLDTRIEFVERSYSTRTQRTRDFTTLYEIYPGLFTDEAPFGWDPQPSVGVNGMLLGGHTGTTRDKTSTSTLTVKSNYTSQFGNHEMKTGIEFSYNTLNIDYGVVNLVFPESNNSIKWDANPVRGGAYIQDKIEYQGFIGTFGLRLDYNDPNILWPVVDPFDQSFFAAGYTPSLVTVPTKRSETQFVLSPRVSISHPITENSKLFFNYGHYKQIPTYEQMLRMSRGAWKELKLLGAPDIKMERTIAYELGFDQSLWEEYLIQIAGFYRDISNQQSEVRYRNTEQNVDYRVITNDAYQDIRGIEATIRKSMQGWWTGFINYTYQVTSSGRFNKGEINEDPSAQRQYDDLTRNLYQSRPIPTPFARLNLTFFTPKDYGMEIGGVPVFANWTLSFLGDWRDGGYITSPNQVITEPDNVEVVDWYNLNLRVSKQVDIASVKVSLFMDVNNLLNIKRLSRVGFYDVNDYLDYFSSLHLPKNKAYTNIVGEDKFGDYRDDGIAFQPIEQVGTIAGFTPSINRRSAIYYDNSTSKYMKFINNGWSEVDAGTMNKILDEKAYIDMPNQTSFNFLDPRDIYFGLMLSFEF
ncbi:MAG: TonB-dependent receptor [Ignavibacteriales bacterium]|nr:TonB-dependent receptor [Ignavibacteriales bacterium]